MTALLRMTAGLFHWAAAFSVLYGLHGIGCGSGWDRVAVAGTSLHRLLLIVAWVGGIAAGAGLALWLRRTAGTGLLDRVAVMLGWVGVAAIVVGGLPIVTIPACL
ncbi:hypothetical protein QLH51_15120 [Sphingomonas sp. 2R-10]|uniref:hypothetical protein n=1 Tax=Sphingomonas sp. 2R-10 TaxID=3045148 RepID=UPI000F77C4AC|nr:hypothetical protein [Sphingomonas sp. 2R-10]MDJ0278128.1 hypothetical protein [Sphingomonas sp. 2R-10]